MYCGYFVLMWTLLVLLCAINCDANKIRSYGVSMDMPSANYKQHYRYRPYNIYDISLYNTPSYPSFYQSQYHQSSKDNKGPQVCDDEGGLSSISSVNCSIFTAAARDFLGCDSKEGGFDVQNRIVGGADVSITEVPYQLNYDDRCGGAILSEYWAITAGHCKTSGKYVIVGSSKNGAGIMIKVEKHYPHPKFDPVHNKHPFNYDFQLLKLATPIVMSENSMPIQIGEISDIVPGAILTITGWGHLEAGGWPANVLQRVEVPIVSFEQCRQTQQELYCISKTMFCAGYPKGGKDACQGDSGGPATVNGKLVGIVSFGYGCALANIPGVYSMVPIARDWIRSVTGLEL